MIIALVISILVIIIKVKIDLNHWGNVNHSTGLLVVTLVLGSASIIVRHPFPLLIYSTFWNPVIAICSESNFFYLGSTAKLDIILKQILGENAGIYSFTISLIALIMSILFI